MAHIAAAIMAQVFNDEDGQLAVLDDCAIQERPIITLCCESGDVDASGTDDLIGFVQVQQYGNVGVIVVCEPDKVFFAGRYGDGDVVDRRNFLMRKCFIRKFERWEAMHDV